jgi:hypothetical protein
MNVVVDVVADPQTGTPIIELGGRTMRWPNGYTAWRFGSETEVLDGSGKRVLVTGHRYRIFPGYSVDYYPPIFSVEPCPPDPSGTTCVLGAHVEGDD